jgi:hypothetical protein
MPEKNSSGKTFFAMQVIGIPSFTIAGLSVLPRCHTFGNSQGGWFARQSVGCGPGAVPWQNIFCPRSFCLLVARRSHFRLRAEKSPVATEAAQHLEKSLHAAKKLIYRWPRLGSDKYRHPRACGCRPSATDPPVRVPEHFLPQIFFASVTDHHANAGPPTSHSCPRVSRTLPIWPIA